jgi:hypothetical protein
MCIPVLGHPLLLWRTSGSGCKKQIRIVSIPVSHINGIENLVLDPNLQNWKSSSRSKSSKLKILISDFWKSNPLLVRFLLIGTKTNNWLSINVQLTPGSSHDFYDWFFLLWLKWAHCLCHFQFFKKVMNACLMGIKFALEDQGRFLSKYTES